MQIKRITCPSCGVILDVRNSKEESVKKIVCPNCKKQLAVKFDVLENDSDNPSLGSIFYGEMRIDLHEGINHIALPACESVEIMAVRLADGKSKCLIRILSQDADVLVNGKKLIADEQVELAIGDLLQVNQTLLSFGKPGTLVTVSPQPIPDAPDTSADKTPKDRNWKLLYACLAGIVIAVVTLSLWPSAKKEQMPNKDVTNQIDTIRKVDKSIKAKKESDRSKESSGKSGSTNSNEISELSDYELEKLAMKENVEAQSELGHRLVHRSGSNGIIRGIKYLQMASRNGSSNASQTLGKVITSLQNKAASGDSIAYQILMSIE